MSIFQELKRRNVFRVAAAYLAVAWLVVQVTEIILPIFGIGENVLRVLVILLVIGFIPAVVVAWLFELTPDGVKPDDGQARDSAFDQKARNRLNQVIVVALVLAVTYFAVDKFVLTDRGDVEPGDAISIAVMPFVNQSDSQDMAFFSDGVAEDILGLLSRTQGLRCISRTSSFLLRDQEIPASEVGERLGVEYVLNGTLRQNGEEIRLSVRLVEAQSETLVWSQNYDRDLGDLFAIQDDISRQVVASIAPTLTASLTRSDMTSANNYVDYLRARHVYLQGRNDNDSGLVLQARQQFTDLLEADPEFARAHAGLADVWSGLAILGEESPVEAYPRARAHAQRALELDPDNAEAWFALADIRVEFDWDHPAAMEAYERALAIAPRDADGLRGYAYFLRQAGLTDEAVAAYDESRLVDPLSFRAMFGLYLTYIHGERYEDAEAVIEEMVSWNPYISGEVLRAHIFAQRGEFERMEPVLPQARQLFPPALGVLYSAMTLRGLGDSAAGDQLILEILDLPPPFLSNYTVASYFSSFKEFDRAIEYLDSASDAREIGLGEALHAPLLTDLRDQPEFWEWIERARIKSL